MTDKELRRLKRVDLLELLIAQGRENDQLREEVEQLRARLEQREAIVKEAGSIAEAALKINRVFEAAQTAADQYIENIQAMELKMRQKVSEADGEAQCEATRDEDGELLPEVQREAGGTCGKQP